MCQLFHFLLQTLNSDYRCHWLYKLLNTTAYVFRPCHWEAVLVPYLLVKRLKGQNCIWLTGKLILSEIKHVAGFISCMTIWTVSWMRCRGRLNSSTLPLSAKIEYSYFIIILLQTCWFNSATRDQNRGVNDTLILVVKQVIHKCVMCLKCEGLSYNGTTTPDLPAERVSDDPPSLTLQLICWPSCRELVIQ